MGIRFRCFRCQHSLNVKDFQAGRKTRCPECDTRFRIPMQDQEYAIPLEGSQASEGVDEREPVAASPGSVKPRAVPQASLGRVERAADPEFRPSEPKQAEPKQAEPTWMVQPPSGGQYGPANRDLLATWIRENRVTPDSQLIPIGGGLGTTAAEMFPERFPKKQDPDLGTDLGLGRSAAKGPRFQGAPPPVPPQTGSPDLATPGIFAGDLSVLPIRQQSRIKKVVKKRKQVRLVMVLSVLAFVLLIVLIAVIIWNPASYYATPKRPY